MKPLPNDAVRVLLYSAGLDSFILRHLWKPDVCLYVDMGTAYTELERERLDGGVTVTSLPLDRWELADGIIPLRNLFLTCVAAQYVPLDRDVQIALAATSGDRPNDKRRQFAQMTSELLTHLYAPQRWIPHGRHVSLTLPVKHMSKAELVAEYVRTGGDVESLTAVSVSCYNPDGVKPCGTCKACARRWIALTVNGIDSTPDCREWVIANLLPRIGGMDGDRGQEDKDTLQALLLTGGVPA